MEIYQQKNGSADKKTACRRIMVSRGRGGMTQKLQNAALERGGI
jgi:hypothetical protein